MATTKKKTTTRKRRSKVDIDRSLIKKSLPKPAPASVTKVGAKKRRTKKKTAKRR